MTVPSRNANLSPVFAGVTYAGWHPKSPRSQGRDPTSKGHIHATTCWHQKLTVRSQRNRTKRADAARLQLSKGDPVPGSWRTEKKPFLGGGNGLHHHQSVGNDTGEPLCPGSDCCLRIHIIPLDPPHLTPQTQQKTAQLASGWN